MSRQTNLASLAALPIDASKQYVWKPGTGWVEATGGDLSGYATDQELADGLANKVNYLTSSQRIKLEALSAGGACYIGGFDADGTTRKWYIGKGGTADTIYVMSDAGAVILTHAGSTKLTTTSGGISVTGTVSATSDRKFKKAIKKVPKVSAISRIMALKAKHFFFTLLDKDFTGFIAQEVRKIYPNSVDRIKGDKGSHLVMTKDEIIADLVVVVQDQQRRLDKLEVLLHDSSN